MSKRVDEYKPLLFTTTLRNPQRMKVFLKFLAKYDGQVLTNEVINSFVFDIISQKKYVPTYVNSVSRLKKQLLQEDVPFSKSDTLEIIQNSKQEHKEAGFDKGWASRFDTWFKFMKELGFVYYEMNKQIAISETGNKLVLSNDEGFEHLENQAFLNAFVKYQRKNPYRRILNDNRPLILLLQVINELKNIIGDSSAGINIAEIPLFICWKNDDYKELTNLILDIRKKYGYTPSSEYIYQKCKDVLGLTKEDEKRFKISNITKELPDEFIRKMRLSGIISIRGMGRFIDINTLEIEKIKYILSSYNKQYYFNSEKEYFDYMKTIDNELIKSDMVIKQTDEEKYKLFKKWVDAFEISDLKKELLILTKSKSSSENDILKFINEPLRLEFLTAISLQKMYSDVVVLPNYSADDEGVPTSFATGGCPDIVCCDKRGNVLFEVTMIVGTQQCIREMNSITRHLSDYSEKSDAYSVFIAPKIHSDTIQFAKFVKFDKNLDIIPLDIEGFVKSFESYDSIWQYR